jgi:hypothetical protein
MKILNLVLIASLSLGLAGCVISEQKYDTFRVTLKKNPDVREKLIAGCIRDGKTLSKADRELYAEIIDSNPATVEHAYCRRLMNSVANGRLTYQDYKDIMHNKPTARVLRLMRGK